MPQLSKQTVKPVRLLLMGEAATGKTGALAQLANAGYRILLHDFDQNSRVIASYLKPDATPVYIQTYEVARMTDNGILDAGKEVNKQAVAELNRFAKQLKHWHTDSEDLGPWESHTTKDVLVIDSLSFMSELFLLAAAQHPEANKHTPTLYRIAGQFQARILADLCSDANGANVIVISHIQASGEKDDDGRIIAATARHIPTGVGEKMSKRVPSYFSDIWELSVNAGGQRQIKTAATNKMALRASNSLVIKGLEDYNLASMFDRLLGAKS